MRADFRGLFSPGAAKPWARTFPEPREFELLRFKLVVLLSSLLTCKDDAKQSKVSTNLP